MAKYRKKPVVVEARQWFKNGDHPKDFPVLMHDREGRQFSGEGQVVRYFRRPDIPADKICNKCGYFMEKHGWIDTLQSGHMVCPGDWIIKAPYDEYYPCKPDIFEATYEPVNEKDGCICTGYSSFYEDGDEIVCECCGGRLRPQRLKFEPVEDENGFI